MFTDLKFKLKLKFKSKKGVFENMINHSYITMSFLTERSEREKSHDGRSAPV